MGLSPFFTDEKAGAEAPAAAWGHQDFQGPGICIPKAKQEQVR